MLGQPRPHLDPPRIVAKLYEAACKGSHMSQGGPDDDGSDENFVYGGPENADGPAVKTGAWVADVTYDRAASQLESANNLKQIGLGVHALDDGAGNSRGYTAGHFALELEGHNGSTGGEDTSSCSSGSLSVLVMDAPVASDFFLI